MIHLLSHLLSLFSEPYTDKKFASIEERLDWAKRNLNSYTYNKIVKSYNDYKKWLVIVLFVVFTIEFIVISWAGSVQEANDAWKIGCVLGNTVRYVNKEKHEINISDYGYNSVNYSDGDYFRVYLDENGNVIKIRPENEVNKLLEDEFESLVMYGSIIFTTIFLLCIFLPISNKTCGKIWREYLIWYRKADLRYEKFTVEE